jgi:hypothetical protein
LQLLLFISHIPDTQLSQLAQSESRSQPTDESDILLSKLASSTHKELSSPVTPKYPDKQEPQVLAVDEQSSRFKSEQGVGTNEQSFQFRMELNKDTTWSLLSDTAEFEELGSEADMRAVDFSNNEEDDTEDEEEEKRTSTGTVADEVAPKLSYTPTQQSNKKLFDEEPDGNIDSTNSISDLRFNTFLPFDIE